MAALLADAQPYHLVYGTRLSVILSIHDLYIGISSTPDHVPQHTMTRHTIRLIIRLQLSCCYGCDTESQGFKIRSSCLSFANDFLQTKSGLPPKHSLRCARHEHLTTARDTGKRPSQVTKVSEQGMRWQPCCQAKLQLHQQHKACSNREQKELQIQGMLRCSYRFTS